MGGSSNDNSFIPKRGPVNRPRKAASQQVYIFTLITYVLFFASLVATAGVFLYSGYIDKQLEGEVSSLNTEIDRFHESEMTQVRDFNNRIENSKDRVSVAASLVLLLSAIENTTAKTAQLESVSMQRNDDVSYTVEASVETDTFDSSIFQREFFEQDGLISYVDISELDIKSDSAESGQGKTSVAFTATLGVSIASIPREIPLTNANDSQQSIEPVIENNLSTSSDDTSEALLDDNQTDL